MAKDPQAFFLQWLTALNNGDWDAVEAMADPEIIIEYPQSGELIRGIAALRRQVQEFPGDVPTLSSDIAGAKVVQEPDRWAITPGYTVVRMSNPNHYTTRVKSTYPDGSRWWLVSSVEMRGELVHRLTTFFAPELPAPLAESIASWPRAG